LPDADTNGSCPPDPAIRWRRSVIMRIPMKPAVASVHHLPQGLGDHHLPQSVLFMMRTAAGSTAVLRQ
jgi:hypothetical protein